MNFGSYFGQYSQQINDLKTALLSETNSTKLADLYLELSEVQEENEMEEAIINALQSLSISSSVHYTKGSINAHHQLGHLYLKKKDFDQAISNYQQANEISLAYSNYKDLASGNLYVAEVYWKSNLFEQAEKSLTTAYSLGVKTKNEEIKAETSLYYGDYNVYLKKNNLALQYYLTAYELAEKENNIELFAKAAYKLGFEFKKAKNLENALDYFSQSKKGFEEIKSVKNLIWLSYEIGLIHQQLNNTEAAIENFKYCLNYAQKIGSELYIKQSFQNIAETYEENNNYKDAYEYLKFYAAIKDTREISELEAQLALEKTNRELYFITKENELHREQIEQEKSYRNIGYIVLLIILALTSFLYLSLRQRGKINEQLKIATLEATRTKQEKEDFFAYTSHEIRTPLNAVVGISKILGSTELSEDQQKYVKTISSSAQNILFLVNDVLDLSKIEKGELKFEHIPLSLREIGEQIVASLSFKKFEKNVEIKCTVDDSVPEYVMGDPVRINQILLNLADNALKFTKQGLVEITIQINSDKELKSGISIRFEVIDTGIGIEEDKIQDIFESYQQAHISTTRQFGGTGLGLSISKLLVEKLGGDLTVTSKINEGSTFSFELPFERAKEIKEGNISENSHKLSNCNLLIVDDNQLNREIFYDLVFNKSNNVSVTSATNGKEAIEMIEKMNFDAILMDLQMPEMDGYETTSYIRKELDEPKKSIPIIAMTAHVLEGVHQKCMDVGMNDTIAKPINIELLTSKIYAAMERKKENMVATIPYSNTTAKIDFNYLNELTGSNPEKIEKYLRMFSKNLPIDLEILSQAVQESNLEVISSVTHKIKGSLVYLGYQTIKDEIDYLEGVKDKSVDENKINTTFSVLQKEIVLILGEINTLLFPLSEK